MDYKDILPYWDTLWKKDSYYAFHDIPPETDGISQLVIKALESSEDGQSMVDIGSGPGTRSIPLAKEKKLDLTLVDMLESAHSLARKRAERYNITCNHVIGDALNLPLDDDSFDYVLSIGLNEHFFGDDRAQVFREMHRVTRKGGRTMVIVPNKLNPFFSLEIVSKQMIGRWEYGPIDTFTPAELKSYMTQFDFSRVETYGVSAITSFVRVLPRSWQRSLFKNESLWNKLVHVPGNFKMDGYLNQYFGEEIMAVGYK